MATKTEKAVERAVRKERKRNKERTELWVLRSLLLLLALLLLFLWAASRYGWWPYSRPALGSAFFTNISPSIAKPAVASAKNGANGASGATGSRGAGSGTQGSSGASSGGSSNGGGSTSTPPSGSSPSLLNFAAGVNTGDTMEQTHAQANGLNEHCVLVVNSTNLGKQQVCTYTQGDRLVTVTYLNDHVISASKSGF